MLPTALRSAKAATRRGFASQAAKPGFIQRVVFDAPSQSSLTEELPGLPALTPKAAGAPAYQVSTLSNGVRVASQDFGGAVSSVGVYMGAGSRHESVAGTSSLLEYMAFSATQKRSALKFQRDVEDAGASLVARTSREVFTYAGESLRENTGIVLEAISEALTQPRLAEWDVEEHKTEFAHLAEANGTDPRSTIVEGIHAAAFGPTSSLGHALTARPSDLEDIDASVLRSFLGSRVTAENVVLVATNVNHDALVEAADKYLLSLAAGVQTTNVTAAAPGVHGPEKPTFIGGQTLVPTHEGGVSHVSIALPAPSLNAKEIHALGVLQALLGSSGSRGAAGAVRLGPQGQSRIARSLHTEAHSFIRSLTAFALPYSDAGLIGLAGSAADHEAGRLVDVMAGFFKDAASLPITAAELDRAKKHYKLALIADVESRVGARDDIGHQLLLSGKRASVADALKAIDAVSAADVQGVAKAALTGKVAISAVGSLVNMPRYDVVASMLK